MRFVLLISLLLIQFPFQGKAETLTGDNNTFDYHSDDLKGNATVTIKRGEGTTEKISISASESSGFLTESDLGAVNAYLDQKKSVDIPKKFKNAEEFVNWAYEKGKKFEEKITDPLVKTYIYNLRSANISLRSRAGKCEDTLAHAPAHHPAPAASKDSIL